MKKVIAVVVSCLLFVLGFSSANADFSLVQLDDLSASELKSLNSQITLAIFSQKVGFPGSRYSETLGIDLSDLTIDELTEIQSYLKNLNPMDVLEEKHVDEPEEKKKDSLKGAEICNYKLLKITVDSAEIKESKWNGKTELILKVTIDNGNDFAYEGNCHFAAINSWEVHPICSFSIQNNLKKREEVVLDITDIDVLDLTDIETMRISFLLHYASYYIVSEEVALTFK